jgi:uroporphyrinogen-III synthase
LDRALTSVREYDWLLFTSANAVEVFAQRAMAIGLRPRPRRIAAIGPATAKAVRETLKLPVDRMPKRYVAEDLVESLRDDAPNASMLLVRAAVARDVIPRALKAAGARVTIANAYRNLVPADSIPKIKELFRSEPPDAITFTSASTAQNLHGLLEAAQLAIPQGTVLASIGPLTSRAMRDVGMEPTVEACEATIASLVDALLRSAQRR